MFSLTELEKLKTAMDLHIRKLEIESDSSVVVSLLHSENYEFHPLATLISNVLSYPNVFL